MASLDYKPGEPIPGTVYKVLRLIGVGGMGTVYDVEDTTIGKRYVVKTLHPKLGSREDLARRVQKEARILARLNHPNIVDVITAGVTSDDLRLPYYVMERLNGQSLRVVLDKKGQLELGHAYHIGIDLLDALDHAHDKGLIHRDVKPDNIFLHRTPAGVTLTKLLDFGIVSVLDSPASETAGRFLGTLRYAAPEQLRGDSPTPKMDVYAAALVIYEILAGRGPFDDEGDASAIGAAHLHKLCPRVSRFVAVPGELDNLLVAALAKEPSARPRDAFSFAASLRNLSRLLHASQRQEATGSRTTSAGVLVPEAQTPVGPRPVDVSPTLPAAGSSTPRLAKTTLPGMAAPTVGAPPTPTPTVPDPLDRMASTGSLATEVAPIAQHGTEAFAADEGSASALETVETPAVHLQPQDPDSPSQPQGPEAAPLVWPAERAVVRSEEPQVRSVPAGAPRVSKGPRVAAGVGAVILAALAGMGVVLHAGGRSSPGTTTVLKAANVPRPVEPEGIVPAPTIATPAFEDVGELGHPSASSAPWPASSALAVTPSSSAAASAARVPAPVKRVAPKEPAAPRYAPDRPGPGF